MRTAAYKPPTHAATDKLGLASQLTVSAAGQDNLDIGPVGALYLALVYLREGVSFTVTDANGIEVLHNRNGNLLGDEAMLDSLYILDKSIQRENLRAVNEMLDQMQLDSERRRRAAEQEEDPNA